MTTRLPVSTAYPSTIFSASRLLLPYRVSLSAWVDDAKINGILRPFATIASHNERVKSILTMVKSAISAGRFSPARCTIESACATSALRTSMLSPRTNDKTSKSTFSLRCITRFLPIKPCAPVTKTRIVCSVLMYYSSACASSPRTVACTKLRFISNSCMPVISNRVVLCEL